MRSEILQRALIGCLALGILAGCFETEAPAAGGGGGVETTTGGRLVSLSEVPPKAELKLIPAGYDPRSATFPESLITRSDDSGRYAFRGIAPGLYNLQAWQPEDGAASFRTGIRVTAKAHTAIPMDTLRPTGKLRLLWEEIRPGFVFIPGTLVSHAITTEEIVSEQILIDSLPAGRIPPSFHAASLPDMAIRRLTDTVSIRPLDTAELRTFEAWAHEALWRLNTTTTGANVFGNVVDFPILVRLNGQNFDFSEARPDGRDVRFTDADGKDLPFETERWDGARSLAEIRVRVPQVDGNSATDFIRMYWGNASAANRSSGAKVFNAANGFAAVWHLGGTGGSTAGGYADATPNGLAGTGFSMTDTSGKEAVIAGGQRFDGSQHIGVGDHNALNTRSAITVSAWIKADSWVGGNRRILQKGITNNQYELGDTGNPDSLGWFLGAGGARFGVRMASPSTGVWHLLHGTYDGSQSKIYLDGILQNSLPATGEMAISNDSLYIGQKPSGIDSDRFQGVLDEVTVGSMARSADWIRLEFANQRPNSGWPRLERLK